MELITVLATAAAESEEHSATAFYITGIVLAVFAVVVGAIGIARPNLGGGVVKGMMAIGAVLAAATMVATVATS